MVVISPLVQAQKLLWIADCLSAKESLVIMEQIKLVSVQDLPIA